MLWAAARLGRPVKWTGERSEAIASDAHGRHQIVEAELALNGEGRILALRSSVAHRPRRLSQRQRGQRSAITPR